MRRVDTVLRVVVISSGALLCLAGCAHAPSASGPVPGASTATGPEPAVPQSHIGGGDAYGLMLTSTACWFGGVWAEAEGEELRSDRKAQTEAHCKDVLTKVYDARAAADDVKMRQLRALEESTVNDIAEKLAALAGDDADKRDLRTLLLTVAGAMRENMFARRAADKVRIDLDKERPVTKLGDDERAAVEPLSSHGAVDVLFALPAGRYATDAHALGVMAAMDRFEIARGIPRHLKIFAVRDMGKLLFGAKAPDVGLDPTKPMQPGTWLNYLVNLSIAAGHDVPASAKNPQTRHDLAWAGVLMGIADKLEPDVDKASERLQPILRNTVAHLRAEYEKVLHPRP